MYMYFIWLFFFLSGSTATTVSDLKTLIEDVDSLPCTLLQTEAVKVLLQTAFNPNRYTCIIPGVHNYVGGKTS